VALVDPEVLELLAGRSVPVDLVDLLSQKFQPCLSFLNFLKSHSIQNFLKYHSFHSFPQFRLNLMFHSFH
jgi:hypothetical protein